MLIYLFRRLCVALLTIWIAVSLAFVALRLLPGDAITAQLTQSGATESQIAARRALLGLDQPPLIQYGQTLGGLLRGDFGYSLVSGRPVTTMIAEQFGATVALALGGLIVAVVIGLGLGIAAALSRLRFLAALITSLLLSSPVYWTGTLFIYLFSVQMRLLPSTGDGSELRFLILPWLVLGLSLAGGLARLTASSIAQYRDADFIRTARSKGLRERRVITRHMLRASLPPVVTLVALQTGFLLGGTVITEMLFVRRGIGQVLLTAVNDRDFPVVQGMVVLSAVIYSLANAIADLLAALLDPRLTIHQEVIS
jgi:ABC-type dipeptide/oligopeptide/nickel transport system permease component